MKRAIVFRIKDVLDTGQPLAEIFREIDEAMVVRQVEYKGIFIEMNSGIAYVWGLDDEQLINSPPPQQPQGGMTA